MTNIKNPVDLKDPATRREFAEYMKMLLVDAVNTANEKWQSSLKLEKLGTSGDRLVIVIDGKIIRHRWFRRKKSVAIEIMCIAAQNEIGWSASARYDTLKPIPIEHPTALEMATWPEMRPDKLINYYLTPKHEKTTIGIQTDTLLTPQELRQQIDDRIFSKETAAYFGFRNG